VPREYWIEPSQSRDLLPAFEQATDWQTAWAITHIVIFHQQISLLSLWDVEYCADMFGGFRAIPLFLQLAPRLRSRAKSHPGDLRRINRWKSDVVDSPVGQLIDLIWCLVHRALNGHWPESFPTDAEMAQTLNRCSANLADLRAGRPRLTMSRFSALWPSNVRNTKGELIAPPTTLLAAAHFWDLIDQKRSLMPVDHCYMRGWHRARSVLGFSDDRGITPNDGWPGYLDRGLDCPAPE
jgi:hypothetical protein